MTRYFRSADASRASPAMRSNFPAPIMDRGATHEPPTATTLGSARKAAAFGDADAAGRTEPDTRQRLGDRLEPGETAGRLGGKELQDLESALGERHRLGHRGTAGQRRNGSRRERIGQGRGRFRD